MTEHVDDNNLTTNDVLPDDAAGAVEIQSTLTVDDSSEAELRPKRQQQQHGTNEPDCPPRKSERKRKSNSHYNEDTIADPIPIMEYREKNE